MLNVSEEVKEPESTLPKGLLFAVAISSLVYLAISFVAVSVVSPELLAQSQQPLVDVVKAAAPGFPTQVFSAIALFAVANTALLNFVMASRLTYGMSKQGLLPRFLAKVHHKRKTPHIAIAVIALILVVLVISGDISNLAKSTSVLLLLSFLLMNLALIRLKGIDRVRGRFEVPYIVPVAGVAICFLMLLNTRVPEVLIAIVLLAAALVSYLLLRPKTEALDTLD
jgi:amino acid transporter